MIKEFQNEYRWLSNFYKVDRGILLGKFSYPSVEHAYMSEKSTDVEWKMFCSTQPNPGRVKLESKSLTLPEYWTDEYKLTLMEDLIRQKFNQHTFKVRLLSTGNQNIQEGNRWGDKFWGVDLRTGEGENHLGRLIMKIRDELR